MSLASEVPVDSSAIASVPELVCFPPAGGSEAMFKEWGAALSPSPVRAINVRRRAVALGEPSLAGLAREIAFEVGGGGPYAFVGHSLGGLVAFETARAICSQAYLRRPEFVVVMGSRPPHASSAELFAPMLDLGDDDLLDALERSGAVNAAFKSSPLRPLFLPALRADLRMITTYRPNSEALRSSPLPVKLLAWHGNEDVLASPALGREWKGYTSARFEHRSFDGGHFFPTDGFNAVSNALHVAVSQGPELNRRSA